MSLLRDIGKLFNPDETVVTCLPNYRYLAGVMYIYGQNIATGMGTYDNARDLEPDGSGPLTPQEYDTWPLRYDNYADMLRGDGKIVSITRVHQDGTRTRVRGDTSTEIHEGRNEFLAIDVEAPLDGMFHYEVKLDNEALMVTNSCQAHYTTKYPSNLRCVPVLISDPFVDTYIKWFDLLSIDPLSYPARRTLYDVIGRATPVALGSVRSTARTSMRLMTRTLDERDDVLKLFESGRILLLRNPDPRYPENNWYISVGDVVEERVHPDHANPLRRWVIEIAVVDRPDGALEILRNDRTYEEVKDFEPDGTTPITPATYAGMNADYGTYFEVLLGGPGGSRSGIGHMLLDHDSMAYGVGRYPTVESARSSWSLV